MISAPDLVLEFLQVTVAKFFSSNVLPIKIPKPNPLSNNEIPSSSSSWAPYKVFNIGNSNPIPLMEFIEAIEKATEKKAIRKLKKLQPGEVKATWANTELLNSLTGYKSKTRIEEGIKKFVAWYRFFYKI